MLVDRVHVSLGNRKLGNTPNVSLLPVITCPAGVPCAKECYARGLMYSPSATRAWVDNTALAMNNPVRFHAEVYEWIRKNKPSFFRWHVSGDVPSEEYLTGMHAVMKNFPQTMFMCFTKRTEFFWDELENLKTTFSFWPGDGLSRRGVRKLTGISSFAWLEGDERAPRNALVCGGSCVSCRACWDSSLTDVVLKKH